MKQIKFYEIVFMEIIKFKYENNTQIKRYGEVN